MVPRQYDPTIFNNAGIEKEDFVLSVGDDSYRKGFDRILSIARNLPYIKFIIIGAIKPSYLIPSNLEFKGFVSFEELLNYYRRAKAYLQLSRWDGMPNTLVEAMLCKCIPIATRGTDNHWGCGHDIPIEISGFTINRTQFDDTNYLSSVVEHAIKNGKEDDELEKAREECIKRYGMPVREKKLIEAIKSELV